MSYKIQTVLDDIIEFDESISENTTNALLQIEQEYLEKIDELEATLDMFRNEPTEGDAVNGKF